jgi:peptide deformylase
MTVLDIMLMGNPILAEPADAVDDPCRPEIGALVADMRETLAAAGGVGLAAPQVNRPLRLMLFEVPAGRTAEGRAVPMTVLINPAIEPLGDVAEEGYEACLSVPGLIGKVPRWHRIGYRGWGLDGKIVEREAIGFHARVVQHEFDHLQGTLYLARMADFKSLAFVDELRRLAARSAARTDGVPPSGAKEPG